MSQGNGESFQMERFEEGWDTTGMPFLDVSLDTILVAEWTEGDNPNPSEVHVHLNILGLADIPLVMRFKGPGTLDKLIAALTVHRQGVWPPEAS